MKSKLRDELLLRAEQDQKMRRSEEWDESVDEENTARLKEVVAQGGWPTISQVGLDASQAAWLLVQHADHDPQFQKQCLKLMKTLPDTEVSPRNIAYLEDRVRVNTDRDQLYGTQFFGQGSNFGPRPIENVEHIDERRKSMGLEPYAEYERGMMETYGDV